MNRKFYIILVSALIITTALKAQFYGNIEFIENKGQWDSQVKFKGDVPAGSFFIRPSGFTVLQHNPKDLELVNESMHNHGPADNSSVKRSIEGEKLVLRSHAYHVDFLGASPDYQVVPDKPLQTYNNYFIGNDPSKWASDCKIYQAVTLKNIYPNIDLRYYTEKGQLKYDIIARPGADIKKIALKYTGADKLEIKNKELRISTSVGVVKELVPYSFTYNGKTRKEVSAKFVLKDNIIRFDVKGYDPTATLVIDPTFVFSTFSGSTGDNWGYTATYGPDGSMFGGGIARASGFPVSSGAFQQSYQGGTGTEISDMAIIKLTPDGLNRVYATYIGGSDNEQPHSLVVDQQGNLVVVGRTASSNYPTTGTGQIGSGGGYEIAITKLNAAGTALIGSKKIGGAANDGVNISPNRSGPQSLQRNYGDDGRSEVLLDGADNIYVASSTRSSNFPASAGVFQPAFGGGGQDGVLIKMTPDVSSVIFASFLGGGADDAAYVLNFDPFSGNIFVAGGTSSTDFPGNQAGTIGTSNQGSIDGFVAVISNDGSSIIRSTYLGTSGIDQVYGVQFDSRGYPYVMGQTTGDWPVTPAGIYSNAGAKQFIAKLQPNLSTYVYSTVFGKSASVPSISPVAFLVDRCENVYVSGWGGGFNLQPYAYPSSGTTGLPVTADAFQSSTDGKDFYFFVLQKNATGQLFGSFFGEDNSQQSGGGGADHVDGGTSRFDRNGVIYQAICANCKGFGVIPFPTTTPSWSPTNPSDNCNLAMVKIEFNLAGVRGGVQSAIDGVPRDTAGCLPLTVDFIDTIGTAQSYEWNFGDGSPQITTLTPDTSHTYTSVGTFTVMLVAIDSNTCNIRDTSYTTIRVGVIEAQPEFTFSKQGGCESLNFTFNNTTAQPAGHPFSTNAFIWDFGDGTRTDTLPFGPINHTFPAPGSYNVWLIMVDTGFCNTPDSVMHTVGVASSIVAAFDKPDDGCVPYTVEFENNSNTGQQFSWTFGDGGTSTQSNPTYTYNTPGTYTITLIATDSATCNISDTVTQTITVYPVPTAAFTWAPDPPIENTPTTFTNNSSNATRFKWDFGDGDTLLTSSMAPIVHQYNATGTFDACLIAYNDAGCADTICQPVRTLIVPVVDVPTAFTPQSGDINSVVMVRGFGIAKMQFIIWNRWGQKVFETSNRSQGWDGKFKGQLQPMDVYAYTLDVEFFDGVKVKKTGDITLIR